MVERIIEHSSHGNSNGSFNRFKDAIFVAVIMGAGWVIWQQQATIDDIKADVKVLKLQCAGQPNQRGGPNGTP